MTKLGINIDHIATLRQARRGVEPDPVTAASFCELAGADGITVHLREDRRHIQERDVRLLRQTVKTKLNLEMAAVEEMAAVAVDIRPDEVCLVPEKRQELTTEGGLDVDGRKKDVAAVIEKLRGAGIRVSVFVDAAERQVRAAVETGAQCVELHTGGYAELFGRHNGCAGAARDEFERLKAASALAQELGLTVNAGHGLEYRNVELIARIAGMNELNIGFSVIARAVFSGLDRAVREMKYLVSGT